MSRVIKFRAKSVEHGEWLYGFYAVLNQPGYDHKLGHYIIYFDGTAEIHRLVDPQTVCQYTGLKDKNGVEIYEGDYCKPPNVEGKIEIGWSEDRNGWFPLGVFHRGLGPRTARGHRKYIREPGAIEMTHTPQDSFEAVLHEQVRPRLGVKETHYTKTALIAAHKADVDRAVATARKEGEDNMWAKTYDFLYSNYGKGVSSEWEQHIEEEA